MASAPSQAPLSEGVNHQGDLDAYLAHIERRILEEELQRHRWNRTATAKALGISMRSLRYRLKKLDIDN
ncbi:MAG: helix-turn-helix domain-containing protein [Halieaceae bacterium]